MQGEVLDAWIHSLHAYFKTYPEMSEVHRLQIAEFAEYQLDCVALTWWQFYTESPEPFVKFHTSQAGSSTPVCIST